MEPKVVDPKPALSLELFDIDNLEMKRHMLIFLFRSMYVLSGKE
jgi:hypothetical protein